jgi:WhiB family redox-sensing transcriptional regulator
MSETIEAEVVTPAVLAEVFVPEPVCVSDPDRWSQETRHLERDVEARRLCRVCPHRRGCARKALNAGRIRGLWAGIVVPPSRQGGKQYKRQNESHEFAMYQLRLLAQGAE